MGSNFVEVQDVLENYRSAVYEKDAERFLSNYASDIHIYDSWDKWECKEISAWRENVKAWFDGLKGEGITLHVGFHDVAVEENLNLAYVHCSITFAAKNEESGENIRHVTNRFTFCLKKINESWMITHEHSSLPIDGETGKGIFSV